MTDVCVPSEVLMKLDSIEQRNQLFVEHAPQLAAEAARKALISWGQSKDKITHVVSVSCTGTVVPGIEFLLIEKLGLRSDVHRLVRVFVIADVMYRVLILWDVLEALQD